MKTHNLCRPGRGAVAVLFGLILLAALAVGGRAAGAPSAAGAASADAAVVAAAPAPQATPVAYYGQVKLGYTVAGVYSETLPAAAAAGPDLGQIDLGFMLTSDAGDKTKVQGYVDLDVTMVFSAMAPGATTGPAVNGAVSAKTLRLESAQVKALLFNSLPATDPQQREVRRQFRLEGAPVPGAWGAYAGEYRETIWDYAPYPVTVVGTFRLESGGAFHDIYLPLIMRK